MICRVLHNVLECIYTVTRDLSIARKRFRIVTATNRLFHIILNYGVKRFGGYRSKTMIFTNNMCSMCFEIEIEIEISLLNMISDKCQNFVSFEGTSTRQ